MGTAKYMVTIRFADSFYPNTYFFDDAALANRFYYDRREYHGSDGTEVQLWKLSDDGQHWDLRLSSANA